MSAQLRQVMRMRTPAVRLHHNQAVRPGFYLVRGPPWSPVAIDMPHRFRDLLVPAASASKPVALYSTTSAASSGSPASSKDWSWKSILEFARQHWKALTATTTGSGFFICLNNVYERVDAEKKNFQDKYKEWSKEYASLQVFLREKAGFEAALSRPASALKVAQCYLKEPRGTEVFDKIDVFRANTRDAVKDLLITYPVVGKLLMLIEPYWRSKGTCEFYNMLVVCLPLDAINGAQGKLQTVSNWADVLQANLNAADDIVKPIFWYPMSEDDNRIFPFLGKKMEIFPDRSLEEILASVKKNVPTSGTLRGELEKRKMFFESTV